MSNYIPELYDTKSKVQFFYNEFKRRDANPEGFDNKMKNWFTSINKYCEEEDQFIVDLNSLRNEFEHMSVRPQMNCLRLVITNMIKERKLLSLDEFNKEFLNCSNENGWINWGFSSVKKTLGWFSSNVSASTNYTEIIDEQLIDHQKYVNLNVFDRMARQVLNYVKENNLLGQILKYNEIEDELCTKLNLNKKQLDLIIKFLECKGNCKIMETNIKLIKFEEKDASITDKELSLMRLADAKIMIETDIEKLEEEIEKFKEEARDAVKQNNKSKGLNILKKKARLTQQLNRKQNQYDNIEILEDQLLNTDTNKKILEVLAKSTEVLKAKQTLPDDVDDLLISVEEAMESHKNLLHDISKPLGVQFDDDELEEELNLLIEEDEIEKIADTSNNPIVDKLKDSSRSVATKSNIGEQSEPSTADQQNANDLYERLRKLKAPPSTTQNKKEKLRYAILDDDI